LLVYVSCWLKHYYPDIFAAALLNSMPMGFYQPAQIVSDARKHKVEVRAIDVNLSSWDNTLEELSGKYCAMRLGFRQISGLNAEDINLLVAGREQEPYRHIHTLMEAGVPLAALEKLADADAFRSMGMDRRQALWEVTALADRPLGLFEGELKVESTEEQQIQLPKMALSEHVVQDYSATALSLKAHPVSFIRKELFHRQVLSAKELKRWPDGTLVRVCGLVLVKQRPGTATGVCFITIEDETGIANLVVFQKLFTKYRKEILRAKLLMVEGKLQREGEVTHIVVRHCYDLSGLLQGLVETDIKKGKQVIQAELFPESRDFK
jgi:error-prone DNA polymerase